MTRLVLIAWLCLGALGLGVVFLEATRRRRPIRPGLFLLALALGPIFLFFVLPLWLSRREKNVHNIEKQYDPENSDDSRTDR